MKRLSYLKFFAVGLMLLFSAVAISSDLGDRMDKEKELKGQVLLKKSKLVQQGNVLELDQSAREAIISDFGKSVHSYRIVKNTEKNEVFLFLFNSFGELENYVQGEVPLGDLYAAEEGCGPCGPYNEEDRTDFYHRGRLIATCIELCPDRDDGGTP